MGELRANHQQQTCVRRLKLRHPIILCLFLLTVFFINTLSQAADDSKDKDASPSLQESFNSIHQSLETQKQYQIALRKTLNIDSESIDYLPALLEAQRDLQTLKMGIRSLLYKKHDQFESIALQLMQINSRKIRFEVAKAILKSWDEQNQIPPVNKLTHRILFEAIITHSMEEQMFAVLAGASPAASIHQLSPQFLDSLFTEAQQKNWLHFKELSWLWFAEGDNPHSKEGDFIIYNPQKLQQIVQDKSVQSTLSNYGLKNIYSTTTFISELKKYAHDWWLSSDAQMNPQKKNEKNTQIYNLLYGLAMGYPLNAIIDFIHKPKDLFFPSQQEISSVSKGQYFAFAQNIGVSEDLIKTKKSYLQSGISIFQLAVNNGYSTRQIIEHWNTHKCSLLLSIKDQTF